MKHTTILSTILASITLLSGDLLNAATRFVDADATGSNSGMSWDDAFTKLQDALAISAPGDEIWVAEGVYYPDEGLGQTDGSRQATFRLVGLRNLYGGFSGDETAIEERDLIENVTILSGDIDQDDEDPDGNSIAESTDAIVGGNSYHLMKVAASVDHNTVVDGFVFTGGHADQTTNVRLGGALVTVGGDPMIRNCRFLGNAAGRHGGAVSLTQSEASFINCVFSGNLTLRTGGAVSILDQSQPTFVNCAIHGNSSRWGGAFYIKDSTLHSINCTITGNSAAVLGGGVRVASNGMAILTSSIIWNNESDGSTTTEHASISLSSSNTSATYQYSLIEHIEDTHHRLDGTDPTNDPLFIDPPIPEKAPSSAGFVGISIDSPARGLGDPSQNREEFDLGGYRRVQGTQIDLGAYEWTTLYVRETANGSHDGYSWGNAVPLLQDALPRTAASVEVRIGEGVYFPDEGDRQTKGDRQATFELHSGVQLIGGYPSRGSNSDRPSSPENHPTILSADIDENDLDPDRDRITNSADEIAGDNSRVLLLSVGTGARLNGLIFTGAHAQSAPIIDVNDRELGISQCQFVGNICSFGGLIKIASTATLILNDSELTGNHTGFDGGIQNRGGILRISNCTFSDSLRFSVEAVANSAPGFCSITNCVFENVEQAVRNSSICKISGCLFQHNNLGVIINSGTLHLEHCEFLGNSRTVLNNRSSLGSCVAIDCLFSGNQNLLGTITNRDANLQMVNCVVTGNSCTTAHGTLDLNGTVPHSVELVNCVIWDNVVNGQTTEPESSYTIDGVEPGFSHCLIANSGGSAFWDSSRGIDLGKNIDADPLFTVPVSPWQAPTVDGDLRLTFESPAKDSGDSAANPHEFDLNGNPRVVNWIDLGPYESKDFRISTQDEIKK